MDESYKAEEGTKRSWGMEKTVIFLLMSVSFLIPVFIIPSGLYSVPFAKSLVVYIGIAVSLMAFLLSSLEKGSLRLLKSPVFAIGALIPVVFLVSSLSSASVAMSLVGYGVEMGTFAFVLAMFLYMYLIVSTFRSKDKVFYSYLLFFASFGIVTVVQLLRFLAGADFLSFGVLTTSVSNLIGSWNDMGAFFGASAILALVTLEMLPLSKAFRIVIWIAELLSLVMLAIVNFATVWYMLAAVSLVFFLYSFFRTDQADDSRRRLSWLSIAILVISVVFIFAGQQLGGKIAGALGIANIEVRPSWGTTLDVVRPVLDKNLLLGSGPNTFQYDWSLHKPDDINATPFWGTDFSYGLGLIPTFLATTGLLGILAWLAFFAAFLWMGVKAIFATVRDQLSHYLLISSFFVSLFLWAIAVVYVPSITMFSLAFFFSGLFLASAGNEGVITYRDIPLYRNAKTGFVTVLVLVFALIATAAGGYYMIRNSLSSAAFQKSVQAATAGDIPKSEAYMQKAIDGNPYDIYYRTLAEIKMVKLNAILANQDEPAETLRTKFQNTLGEAIQAGLNSVEANPASYQNHVGLGQIYESVVPEPFKIQGAYEKAREEYEKAFALSPKNPAIKLLLGRLEIANGDNNAARDRINEALKLKADYADAYFLLSQVEAASGDLKKAIASAESTTYLAPNNAGVYFQLGLLKYNDGDWNGAVVAFKQATNIVKDYANAKYFLGLSYDKVGRRPDAIKEFQELRVSNPDNEEVRLILENLNAGREPFANAAPPVDNKPEKRENPPIKQP